MTESRPAHEVAAARTRFRDVTGMVRTTLTGRCPACSGASMFAGAYTLHATCPTCGVRFERDPGTFLGALAVGYGLTILALVATCAALLLRFGAFPGFMWTLIALAVVYVLLVYRLAKSWWTWWMYAAGFVYRDDDPAHAHLG